MLMLFVMLFLFVVVVVDHVIGSAEERLVSRSRILSGEKYHVVLST